MSSFRLRPTGAADARGVAETMSALESALYGQSTFSQADLESDWADVDLERNTRVAVDDAGRVVGYAALHERGGELMRAEAVVHPDAHGRGVGTQLATAIEREARARGAQRVQSGVFERDVAGARLLEALGYRAVRVFRELRIELTAEPAAPRWPEGLRASPFEEREAEAFHAAQQEAFADHWEHNPRPFEQWRAGNIEQPKFDPSLWCVVRAGDEIVAGSINVADLYGGGYVATLFTRRPWRGRGVGTALLQHAFARFWERGERSVGLGVDAQNETGAFRLYERAGMTPALGWKLYEKALDDRSEAWDKPL